MKDVEMFDVRWNSLYPHERDYSVEMVAESWRKVVLASDYDKLASDLALAMQVVEAAREYATRTNHRNLSALLTALAALEGNEL